MPPAPLSTPLRSRKAASADLEVPRCPGTWPISQIARRRGGVLPPAPVPGGWFGAGGLAGVLAGHGARSQRAWPARQGSKKGLDTRFERDFHFFDVIFEVRV